MLVGAVGDHHHGLPDVPGWAHVAKPGSDGVIERGSASHRRHVDGRQAGALSRGERLDGAYEVGEWSQEDLILRQVSAGQRAKQSQRFLQLQGGSHAAAGVQQDQQADGLVLRSEEGDLLGAAILQNGEIRGGESAHVAALPVGDLNGDRLQIDLGLEDRFRGLSQRQRCERQKMNGEGV